MDKSARFWDRVSRNTDRQTSGYDRTAHKVLEKTRPYLDPGDVVLDFACGTGTLSCDIASHVQEVTGIDISSGMLDVAKAKSTERGIENVRFVRADVFDERFDLAPFDVILAFNVLHLLRDAPQVLQRINDLLKPGGVFISTTPCLGAKWAPLNFVLLLLSKVGLVPYLNALNSSQVEDLVAGAGFQIVEAQDLEHKPPNGFILAQKPNGPTVRPG